MRLSRRSPVPDVGETKAADLFNKVPEVTLVFWIIKIMATTVGETGADFLIFNFHLGLTITSAIMSVLLLIALFVQVRMKTYVPSIYWIAVVMISIVGTLLTDNLSDKMRVPLEVSTAAFSVLLAATFAVWYASEKTLSIHTIFTVKRELFYWAAILFTFALGTAAGDLLSERMGLGYLVSGFIFAGAIAVVAIAHFAFRANSVLTFWIAYILTRPFGASFGDLVSQPRANGGLGLGTVNTSTVFLAIIVMLVVWLSLRLWRSSDPSPRPSSTPR
jgi:uncharacterized membrane-anchored protein